MSINVFKDQVVEEKGETARLSSFVGAIAVGDLVKTTLGPKGMDKLLTSASTGASLVTNDGATILKSIPLDNPAAKVLVNISKVQDDEIGDGTTSVTVLGSELLREAEKLIDQNKIHPQTIIEGYRMACKAALESLQKIAISYEDFESDQHQFQIFKKELLKISNTTLSSKILSQDKQQFSEIAVNAILRLKNGTANKNSQEQHNVNLDNIQVLKIIGGKLSDSFLDEGFILNKSWGNNQPKVLENCKVLIANTTLDTDKIKIFGTKFKVDSTSKLAELEKAEKSKMKAKIEKISKFDINCFINRQLIYDYPEQLFTDLKINTIEHADFEGIERLALVLGGEVVSTFDNPELCKKGYCDKIEEIMIGEKQLLRFSGCHQNEACTIVLRGATEQVLDEAERSLHDALAVLSQTVNDSKTVYGGGCSEMIMSKAVDTVATNCEGKKQLAIESFAKALRQLPTILADNAGFDSSELVTKLRSAIYNGMFTSGLDLNNGSVGDMKELGIVESYKLKKAVVSSASEAAEVLLRVDNIIRAKPRTADRNNY
ncbi:T-complex protein 1 subunit beta [Hanseniaspora osmophila]|uniref:CCT-beta n=1 Tax=Hanseniaspora osmophila TaxID=56408 RepID=A0A1E5RNT1_9ASCO|nr:T-complex protein 1 subunit beta [Hanseniaspora osmophila]